MVLVLAVVALQTTGVGAAVVDMYGEDCGGDGRDENCSPGCDECSCCVRVQLLIPTGPGDRAGASVTGYVSWAIDAPPESVDLGEIVHVPKSARAV